MLEYIFIKVIHLWGMLFHVIDDKVDGIKVAYDGMCWFSCLSYWSVSRIVPSLTSCFWKLETI